MTVTIYINSTNTDVIKYKATDNITLPITLPMISSPPTISDKSDCPELSLFKGFSKPSKTVARLKLTVRVVPRNDMLTLMAGREKPKKATKHNIIIMNLCFVRFLIAVNPSPYMLLLILL